MAKSLSEMKRANKKAGRFFFEKGNNPVVSKQGNYLVTKASGSDGYNVYKFNERNGHIDFVDNPNGEYEWEPHKSKSSAIAYARSLNK